MNGRLPFAVTAVTAAGTPVCSPGGQVWTGCLNLVGLG
jgi:hypothetical protein